MWNPDVYLTFADHRGRPFFDLTSRVGAEKPRRVVDLGCGPGNLTATLDTALARRGRSKPGTARRRWSSRPASAGSMRRSAMCGTWAPQPDTDVVVSNATLQWVPEHSELLVRWAGQLAAGSWIAMQVPGNFDAPSHEAVRELARRDRWRSRCRTFRFAMDRVSPAAGYAGLLTDAGCRVDAWETDLHPRADRRTSGAGVDHRHRAAAGDEPAVRGGLAAVPSGADSDARRVLSGAVGRQTFFPFRRIFVVAQVK